MPAYYYLGQPFRDELTVEDITGALVDPDTVTSTYRYPDGHTEPGPAAVRDSVGRYHADVTLDDPGRYRRVWTTTGPGAGVDVLDIVMTDPFADQIVGLAGVKRHLNIDEANDSFDVELNEFVAALPPVIEQLAGPVLPVTRTETLYSRTPGRAVLVVSYPPIATLVSMTNWGTLDVGDFEVDKAAGVIRGPIGWPASPLGTEVSYVSGYTEVPGAINLAARIIVEHWWESQRAKAASGRADRVSSGDLIDVPGMGFAIPRYAAELLQPFNPGTGLH
jgi:hypothetical protein